MNCGSATNEGDGVPPGPARHVVSYCNIESCYYAENVDYDITPRGALQTAESARTAAAARSMPAWFPAVTAALFAACLTGVGSAQLIGFHHVAAKITGFAGTACGIAFGLMYILLIVWWKRSGVIPLPPSCAEHRSGSRDLWITTGILAASAAAWAATGHLGWATIVFGIAEGVHHWRRLLPRLFGPASPVTPAGRDAR